MGILWGVLGLRAEDELPLSLFLNLDMVSNKTPEKEESTFESIDSIKQLSTQGMPHDIKTRRLSLMAESRVAPGTTAVEKALIFQRKRWLMGLAKLYLYCDNGSIPNNKVIGFPFD